MTKQVKIGNIVIGGGAPIAVQSMLNVHNSDIEGNVAQAVALEKAGCEIVRVSVPNAASVALIPAIKNAISIPLVADIHFDGELAIKSVEAGVDKVRINPGNIGSDEMAAKVIDCCKLNGVPIRVGVNSGSVEKEALKKYGGPTPEALVESALHHVRLIEKQNYDQIVISIKSSDVAGMVKAYTLMSRQCDYPLHLGVTEAGTVHMGTIKSAIGIGSLLLNGIGDTIRVSLTGDCREEVAAGKDILLALGLRKGVELVSCPTCGRTEIDLIPIAEEVERRTRDINKDIKVAVMGCIVNGPGEASNADIGIAGGKDCAVLFKKGEIVRKLTGNYADELVAEIHKL